MLYCWPTYRIFRLLQNTLSSLINSAPMKWKLDCFKQENMKYRYLIFMQVVGYLSGGFDNQATSLALPEI